MRFDVITLFPELFAPFLACGVTRRAYASGQVQVHLWNPRDHAEGNYRRVDDRPFGGGDRLIDHWRYRIVSRRRGRAGGRCARLIVTLTLPRAASILA